MESRRTSSRRARWALWILVALSMASAGALSSALTARPGAMTGLRVAGSGVALLLTLTLAARVMLAIERWRRQEPAPGAHPPGGHD